MFLTIELARLPCWTTFSRLPLNIRVSSSIPSRRFLVDRSGLEDLIQLVDQFGGQGCKIIDEIEWVLDLVGDAGGELTK